MMKFERWIPYLACLAVALVVGCGGGGGGGSSTTGGGGPGGGDPIVPDNAYGLKGNVLVSETLGGLGGLTVRFYAADGALVADGYTSSNGSYTVLLPTTAVYMQVLRAGVPSYVYGNYSYGGEWFGLGNGDCRMLLPTMATGRYTNAPNILFVLSSSPPPPPPSGCR